MSPSPPAATVAARESSPDMNSDKQPEEFMQLSGNRVYVVFVLWLVFAALVWGSGHDWKSSGYMLLPFLPFYVLASCGFYFFVGYWVTCLCRRIRPANQSLPLIVFLAYAFVVRIGEFWPPAGEGLGLIDVLALSMIPFWSLCTLLSCGYIGIICARRRRILTTSLTVFAVFGFALFSAFMETNVPVNILSTTGTYLQFHSEWESWGKGENLPRGWTTFTDEGVRFVFRDHGIFDDTHGYYLVLDDAVLPPTHYDVGRIVDTRKLPNGWVEFVGSSGRD